MPGMGRKSRKRGGRSSKSSVEEFSTTSACTRQTSNDTVPSDRRGTGGETDWCKKKKSHFAHDADVLVNERSTIACGSDLNRQPGDNETSKLSLRVTSLPSTSTKESISIYFEAQGENVDVQSVEVLENETAIVLLVNITEEEKGKLLKKKHKIYRKLVEVEEITSVQSASAVPEPELQADLASNMLLVSNLPECADKELIKGYFESPQSGGCVGAIESVEFIEPKVVQVTLKNREVATNILKQKTHELQSSELQVRCLEESLASVANATLEVTNLPQDCTEEMLKSYFEDSKCGGCSGAVKAIKIVGSEVAQVEFTNATIAGNVLAKKEHKLNGIELRVNYSGTCKEKSLPSSVNGILEISNLPQNVGEEMLELYFESPKAGGCPGAVNNITLIEPGIARVQFDDTNIADAVMMRTHKLHGMELQVKPYKESSMATAHSEHHDILEVSGLPDGVSEGLIELYFEGPKSGGCADAVKDISFVRPGVARIQFSSDTVAANVIAKQEHKLQGSQLQVQYVDNNQKEITTYPLDDTLEVSNLPVDVSEDLLALYFESPKSGGCADAVKSVTFSRPGVARIQFSSTKTAAEVVAKKMHQLNGAQLEVKFAECFHEQSTTKLSDDTLLIRNLPKNMSEEYLQLYFESHKSGGCTNGVKEVTLVEPGVATVCFSSPKIAGDVFAKECHRIAGAELQVQYLKLSHDKEKLQDEREPIVACDILEVSSVPPNITKDHLQLYFESLKSGGYTDCVKNITMVKPGVFHIQFTDATNAANIFSRKMHKLGQAELKVKYLPATLPIAYEMDKLILQNVPGVEEDYLNLFVATCLQMSEEQFSISLSKDKVLITFSKEYSLNELQTMAKNLQSRRLKEGNVTAILYEVCRSIVVHNITEHYEEEYILMYFESSGKSGGGRVKNIHMLGEGEVIIVFEDPKVISTVVERSHHSLGLHVKIERNDPLHSRTESSENISSIEIVVDSIIARYLSKCHEQLTELVKDLHIEIKFDGGNGKILCTSTKFTKAEWKKTAKRMIRSYIDSNCLTLPDQRVPKDALQELCSHLINKKGFEFDLIKDGTVLKVGGDKTVVQSLGMALKDMFDRYTIDTVDTSFAHDPESFHFLVQVKLPELRGQLPQVQITEDKSVPSLKLRGSKKEIAKFKEVLPKLGVHSKVTVEVQPHITQYIGTDDGQMQLRNLLKQQNVQAALYVTHQQSQILLCNSAHVDSVKKVVSSLPTVMSVGQCRVPRSFVVEQDEYQQLRQKYEKQCHVQVTQSSNVLIAAGLKSGVDLALKELNNFIQTSCNVDDFITIERGELRLLLSHMKARWDTIDKNCKSSDFTVTMTVPELQEDDEPVSKIHLTGERDCVKDISDQISQLRGVICKRTEHIKQADANYFTSEMARTYLDGIESRECVIIEVVVPESNSNSPQTFGGKQHLKCTAKLTEKISVYVFIGDICDFDAADVIVNAANSELKHIGGVAWAISKKGGPVIDEESARYIKNHSKLKTGDAWLTKKVGGLPCKALVHAVGPQWSGIYRKEAPLLESACTQALQKSQGQGYRSIAFPAISAGVYGFPIDKCAQCMVNAVAKFSNSNPTSDMRSIHFIVHPSKSADVRHFISALKHQLPADSVNIVSENIPNRDSHSSLATSSHLSKFETRTLLPKIRKPPTVSAIPPGVLDCIKILKGSLLDVQADVYVNTTNGQLNLSSGAVSVALLKAGGQRLQDECTKKAPVKTGDIAVTGPGQIPCKHIFHTVIPSYNGKTSEKILKSSINKCLKECASRGMVSVAIPSIGTGNLKFPKDVVAKITVDEAVSFLSSKKRGSLEFIHLVIFMEDVYRAFQAVLSGYTSHRMLPMDMEDDDHDMSSLTFMSQARNRVGRGQLVGSRSTTLPSKTAVASGGQMFNIDTLKVTIISGDITESTCDVVVNPTNSKMKLTGAGVAGAILTKGGQEQQNLCDAVIGAINTLSEEKVVHTIATGDLKCKHIFHINHEGRDLKKLTKVILMCLNEAEKNSLTSIAFPAIGAGTNRCSPQESAASMLQAIRMFASSNPIKLCQIQVVVYESPVHQAFLYAFRHPEEPQPSMIRQAFSYLSQLITGGASKSSSDPKVVQATGDIGIFEELEVSIYGETETAVNKAQHKVRCWIDEALSDRKIDNKYIQNLPETDEENLRKVCKDLHVEIHIDRDSSCIKLKGNRISVDQVHIALTDSLHQYEKKIYKEEHAKQLYEMVRWKRMGKSSLGGEEYDSLLNYEIEMAHRAGKATCIVGTKNDIDYFMIDFVKNEETDLSTHMVCDVERIDILKQLQEGEKPQTWEKMPHNCSLHVVKLDSKSSEYADVMQNFDQTMQGQYKSIVEIERIQNPALYLPYVGRRKQMDKQNPPGHQNERLLFHGTSVDTCPKINRNGFNRSFAGKNATAYGRGVYFARDARLSASDTYSPRDHNGYKYVYLVRALTGEFTTGNMSMIVPPHKDPANFIEYDSVVNNIANPTIFVIFNDALVYPDYLITFA